MYTRRKFIEQSLKISTGLCLFALPPFLSSQSRSRFHSASYYQTLERRRVKCELCFRGCVIQDNERGFCKVRENDNGKLYSVVFGNPAAVQLDPIEKEPMYHLHPSTNILCIGTAGCNFKCQFCHNWHLSQATPEELRHRSKRMTPEEVVNHAKNLDSGLSFTYNEPTIFWEYMYEISKLGRREGLTTIFHTNGGMRSEPLKRLLENMMGVTVDLKGFTADFYRDVSFASMEPVLNTLRLIKSEGKWLEIVNLIIPTLNDDLNQIKEMCSWIVDNLGTDVPVHFNRFSPAYKMKHLKPTPISQLERARNIATEAGIRFVYVGNAPGHRHNSTFCPSCKKRIIHRTHFMVNEIRIKNGNCEFCKHPIPGVWKT
ncbi:MAG: AmmeMemoRadiSam system radical SAM enzyme [Chlorobiaceae bacterium]|nr:AmmeMemoRadiSam system radical SAM enzyme [Chlorobiaceae bacterium]